MKAEGKGKLLLFKIQSGIDIHLQQLSVARLFKSMSLEMPEKKGIQSFDIPIIPKKEDFMLFPFRQLSATIVGGGSWKATDFSNEAVLKKSTNLMRGVPAYLNHVQLVMKEIGNIGDPEWTPAYKNDKGDLIPSGIDAPFVIDSLLQPELCRKLSSPVSPINSCSVTVVFDWEASHDFEREGDFYWHIGEMIDDGKGTEMVRRIATKIIAYEESSLVWLGADPYAKMLDSTGQVVNIDRASAFAKHKLAQDPDQSKYDPTAKFWVFDCLDSEKFLHLSKSSTEFIEPKTEKTHHMNEELLQFLSAGFGIKIEDLKAGKFDKASADKFKIVASDSFSKMKSVEDFEKEVQAKTKAEGELATTKTELTKVQGEKTAIEQEKTKLEPMAKIGTDVLKAGKDEAKRLYGIFSKQKPEKTILDEIEAEIDFLKLEKKIEMFGGQAISQFGGSCSKCGNKDIKFRSSVPKEGEEGGNEEESFNLADHI